ncbi:MAG: WXG100 family type VII secretion target [Trebonia sp.]
MPFDGMDVEQLRGLARQIDADAQALYNLVNSLNGVMGGLVFLWNGPMAATFEQDWQFKNRPALLTAYNTLTNLHTHLVDNINQQDSASAAEGGWTAERVVGDGENALAAAGLLGTPVSAIMDLTQKVDKDPTLWSRLTEDHASFHYQFSNYQGSRTLTWMHDSPNVAKAGKFLGDTHIDDVLKGAGLISMGIGAYHTAGDAFHVGEDLGEGHYAKAANDLVDGVSDGLKTYPNPVSYGLGVDVKLLHEVANLDWKDTPNPLSGDNWKTIYAPELSSMKTGAYWEQVGKTLWGAL